MQGQTDRQQFWARVGFGVVLATLIAAMLPLRGFAQEAPAPPKENSLYKRMGGYDVIAAVVDDFIGQLAKDEAFKRFGGGRSGDSLHRTRQLVVDQICYLAGGPCAYIGRDTKTAHAGLAITQEEWDLSLKHFKTALDDQKVGDAEQKDFVALIQKLHDDIVEKPKGDYPKQGSMKP
ncbi:MAG TPA: group 1 truncated hemoglobin [Terriglobia bacterium]|nr:group 1 truncated hemoglobin [Terriglobia bacterium]